jgi:hypothetical protein
MAVNFETNFLIRLNQQLKINLSVLYMFIFYVDLIVLFVLNFTFKIIN